MHLGRTACMRKHNNSLFIGYLVQNRDLDLRTPSGPQIHILKIIEGLEQIGHRIRLVRLTTRGIGIEYSDNRQDWFPVPLATRWRPAFRLIERPIRYLQTLFPAIPYANFFDSLRFADAAFSALNGVDVLYERYSFMAYGGVLLSRRTGIPLILEVNGHPFDEMSIGTGPPMSKVQRAVSTWLTRFTMSECSLVLPSGFGWEKRLIETGLLKPGHSQVIWPGAELERFSASEHDGTTQHRTPASGPTIAYLGSFQPWQGLGTLIDAFAVVLQRYPDAQLLLIGDGSLYHELVTRAEDLGCSSHISFKGMLPQDKALAVVKEADIVVQLYERRAEYVGMKLFDYLAAGKPVVVTAPSRRHDLIRDQETGLVILPGDSHQLADALTRLIADDTLRRRLGQKASRLVQAHHTWSHRAKEVESCALTILRRRCESDSS